MRLVRAVLAVALVSACSREPAPSAPASAEPTPQSSAPAAAKSDGGGPAAKRAPEPKRPYNVLLVMIDSLRADMPWAGYERPIAPRLTELQKSCVTYTRAYSLSSYTAKSVAPALVGEIPGAMKRDGFFFTRYPDPDNLFISERAQQAGHRTLAGHAHGYFLPAMGMNQGFDDYRLTPGGVDVKAVTSVTSEKLTKLAIDMLSDPKNVPAPGKRFFAYFHYLDPHHTYEKHRGHPDFGNKPRDVYDNEVHFTDAWVGKLLDFVRSQAWAADTAIVITSDHGEGFGEHGHHRHAYELWESLVKIPMLFCVPGAEPRQIEVRRSQLDLAPTIADLMALPADPPFRGESLVPELFGASARPRRIVADLPRSDLMDRRRALITEHGTKIIGFGDDSSFHVYDLEKDPTETENLATKEPDRLEAWKKIYLEESAKIPNVEIVGGAPLKGAPAGRRW